MSSIAKGFGMTLGVLLAITLTALVAFGVLVLCESLAKVSKAQQSIERRKIETQRTYP